MDITYDEGWTISSFSNLRTLDIITYTHCDANNHIANTLLIKLFHSIFGTSKFISRLPNVLAFAVYLLFSYKIATKFLNPLIGVSLFIALFSNPFLIDFFGLARGYGIALSFMIVSIYYVICFLETFKFKYAYFSLFAASFAVISNFPLINYWLGLFFTIHLAYYFKSKDRREILKLLGVNTGILIFLAFIIYEPIRKLVNTGSLFYGGHSDFYTDTLLSLTAFSLYDPYNLKSARLTLNIILGFLFFIFTISLVGKFQKLRLLYDRKYLLAILLIIPIVSNIIQYYLFGTHYLIDRTALFYYPLIIIVFFFFANDITNLKLLIVSKISTLIICSGLVINLIIHLNLFKTITWDHDSRTTEILTYLNDMGTSENKTINLDSSWPFQSSLKYYLENNYYKKVRYIKKERDGISSNLDYYLYYDRHLWKVGYNNEKQPIHNYNKDTILQFPNEKIYLFSLVNDTNKTMIGK